MPQGKQAKVLTERNIISVLAHVDAVSRYPLRDRTTVLLSTKAGLRAVEISRVTWGMVLDGDGLVGECLELPNRATKGRTGGRSIPLHPELKLALTQLQVAPGVNSDHDAPVIFSERGIAQTAGSITVFFYRLYKDLGIKGASSHSGRRTFVTQLARKCSTVGGSLKDVQRLAGHARLNTTERYIDASEEAQRRMISLI
jgi:integrase/recombinase XerC